MSVSNRSDIERRKAETRRRRELSHRNFIDRHSFEMASDGNPEVFSQSSSQQAMVESSQSETTKDDLSESLEQIFGKWTLYSWKAGNPQMINDEKEERSVVQENHPSTSRSSSSQHSGGEPRQPRSQSASSSHTDSAKEKYNNHMLNSHHRRSREQRSESPYKNHSYEPFRGSSSSSSSSYSHRQPWHTSQSHSDLQSSSQGSSSSTSHRKPNPPVPSHGSGPAVPVRGTSSEREGQQHHPRELHGEAKHGSDQPNFQLHPSSHRKSRMDTNHAKRVRGPTTPPCSPPPNHSEHWTPSPPDRTPMRGGHTPPPRHHTPPPRHHTPPPRHHTPPPRHHTPPPRHQTPPPRHQTPPPRHHTPPPRHHTPPPSNRTSPFVDQAPHVHQQTPPCAPAGDAAAQRTPPPTQSAAARSDAKAGDSRKRDLTLNIPRDNKLHNIFKEMSVTTPITALSETPVKCKKAPQFNFHEKPDLTVNSLSEMKVQPVLSPLPEPDSAKTTEPETPQPPLPSSLFMSSLSKDLEVSDDSDIEEEVKTDEVKEEEMKEEVPEAATAAKVEENHSSSDESSSSDSSLSHSESESSSSESEDEEDGTKEDADSKPESALEKSDRGNVLLKDPVDTNARDDEDSKNGKNESWGLGQFVNKATPAALNSSRTANNSSASKEGSRKSQDVSREKSSPRKMSEIGPCNSMPFIADEDTLARNCEKSSTSPDSLTPSSQTSSLDTTTGSQTKARRESASDPPAAASKTASLSKPASHRSKAASDLNSKESESASVGKPATNSGNAAAKASNQQSKPRRTNSSVKASKRSESSSPSEGDSVIAVPSEGKSATHRQQKGVSSADQSSSSTVNKKTASSAKAKTPSQNNLKGASKSAGKRNSVLKESLGEDKRNKAARDCSAADIGSILKDVSVPPMLSPTIPLFSNPSHKSEAQSTGVAIPTLTCGKPSIVVRISRGDVSRSPRPLSCLRHKTKTVVPGKKGAGKVTDSSVASTPPGKGRGSHPSESKQSGVKNATGKTSGGDVKRKDCVSVELSPSPPSKRKKTNSGDSSSAKKPKASTSHINNKPSPEINGVAHPEEIKKAGTKRPLERRSSVSSNSSRSSQKSSTMDSASSSKKEPPSKKVRKSESTPQAEETVTKGSTSDKAGSKEDLPFDSYKQPDSSPKPAAAAHLSCFTDMLESDDLLSHVLERVEDWETYKMRAKQIKRSTDKILNDPNKGPPYLLAILNFVMTAVSWEKNNPNTVDVLPVNILQEVMNLLLWVHKSHQECNMTRTAPTLKEKKLSVLIYLMLSILYYKLYSYRQIEVARLKKVIDSDSKDKKSSVGRLSAHAPSPHQNTWNKSSMGTPSPMSPTPSPACSIGSVESQREDATSNDQGSSENHGNRQANGGMNNGSVNTPASPAMVMVEQRMHSVMQKYISYTHLLVRSDSCWLSAMTEMSKFNLQDYFHSLDRRYGALSMRSKLPHLVFYSYNALMEIMTSSS